MFNMMLQVRAPKSSIKLCLAVIGLFYILYFILFRWTDRLHDNWISTIESDGLGYYVYLPSLFIYQDANHSYLYSDTMLQRYEKSLSVSIDTHDNGKKYSKYYIGTSILLLPFFLLGLLFAFITGYPVDGYSLPFQLMVFLAALSYMLAGLLLISKILKKFRLSEFSIVLTLVCISLGTNLFNYTWFEASFSHVYSFFLVSVLLLVAQQYFELPSRKLLAGLFAIVGFIIITRPTTVLAVIGIGMVAGTREKLIAGLAFPIKQLRSTVALLLIPITIICFQLFTTFLQVDTWQIWTYKEEGFNFLDPQFFKFLFGYEKGLFVYSPILIFSLFGGITWWKKNKREPLVFLFLFLLVSYVLSSWWCWWYGAGFGSRSFVDYYSILAIPMAIFFNELKPFTGRWLIVPIASALVLLSLIFHYQYRYNIIAWGDMDAAKFWQVFLRTDSVFRWSTSDEVIYAYDLSDKTSNYYFCDFEKKCREGFDRQKNIEHLNIASDNGIIREVSRDESFGAPLRIPVDSSLIGTGELIVSYDCQMKIAELGSRALVVCTIHNNKDAWQGKKIIKQVRKTLTWYSVHFEFKTPQISVGDTVVVYTYNTSEKPVWINDVKVGIHSDS
mgnify:CR=1 FL=1